MKFGEKQKISKGFTLIEVVMFLAISAGMFIIFSIFIGNQQGTVNFRDAVDNILSQVQQARTEATTTYRSGGNSNDVSQVVFGRALEFDTDGGNQVVRKSTLLANNGRKLTSIVTTEVVDFTIPWGSEFVAEREAGETTISTIVFTRDFNTGNLNTYGLEAGMDIDDPASYSDANSIVQGQIQIRGTQGQSATIFLDAERDQIIVDYDDLSE